MEAFEKILNSMRIDNLLKRIRVTEYLQKRQLGKKSFAQLKRSKSYYYSSQLKPMTDESRNKAQEKQSDDEFESEKDFNSESGSSRL